MELSPGDTIAIGFGCIGIAKWGWDSFSRYLRDGKREFHDNESRLTQLLSDFAVHQAEDRKDFLTVTGAIEHLDAKIDQALAQLRNAATLSANSFNDLKGFKQHD